MFATHTQVAPDCLMGANGLPIYGHFDGIVPDLGLARFKYTDTMDKPASKWARHFHFKQFQFVSLVTPRYVIGAAIADIRYLGSGFCYLYDIQADSLTENNWLKPPGMGYGTASSPQQGMSHIGKSRARMTFEIVEGLWRLKIDSPEVQASLSLIPEALSLPMAMCNPTGYSGWTYTQKHNGLRVEGSLTVRGESQPLQQALAGYDFSAGFMRRDTSWRWASVNARLNEGVMGLNLAAGVNETGCSENVFWIDGERHLLGPVHFEFSRGQTQGKSVWRVFSDNGQLELTFTARNCRSEKLNLWLLKSNFRQYLGHFNGRITDNLGRQYQLNNVLGLTEDHYARW
jgi:hypothetical protein